MSAPFFRACLRYLLPFLLCATAHAQTPKIRTSISTNGDFWVGQRVTLAVELLAPGFFASAATFDLPGVPNLLLVPPSGSPVVSSETIDGTSYTVQRHEVAVFARRAGDQVIPPFSVRFLFKANPLDKETIPATVRSEPVRFRAKIPPGAEKLGNVLSARQLEARETWQPEPGKAKAGDAFTRTIVFTAPEVPAMAFPPFPAGKIDGLGIYPKPPEVLDENERGLLTGKRRETISYVCQRPGRFTIPATCLTWFDLDAQALRTIDFPARTFDVAANPALTPAAAEAPTPGRAWHWVAVAGLAIIGVATIAFLLWRSRAFWRRVIDAFRPVRLAPLNPERLPATPSSAKAPF